MNSEKDEDPRLTMGFPLNQPGRWMKFSLLQFKSIQVNLGERILSERESLDGRMSLTPINAY
jgi:hypothetical protein